MEIFSCFVETFLTFQETVVSNSRLKALVIYTFDRSLSYFVGTSIFRVVYVELFQCKRQSVEGVFHEGHSKRFSVYSKAFPVLNSSLTVREMLGSLVYRIESIVS